MSGVSERDRRLERACRTATARAAELVGGGIAVLLTGDHPAATSLRVRAAAGFATPEAARQAADALGDAGCEAALRPTPTELQVPPALQDLIAGPVLAVPLVCDGRSHGILMAAGNGTPPPRARQGLARTADRLALRMDHAHLSSELAATRELAPSEASGGTEGDPAILQISEALFAQDIELLRSQQELGRIEKLKNDFIEKMSCELRTPLNGIIEAIIAVLAGENDALSDSAKQSLRGALDEGTAFLRTLQNILDLWRIKQGELPVEIQEVSFRDVVNEAIFSVQDTLGAKPVTIERAVAEPFPKVRTDVAKINQILFLLLDNAVKFTPRGSVTIRAALEGDQLACSVEDTGMGIAADDRELVFDEFFQVDEHSTTQYRGAGLGLTLARELLTLLDGEIELTSDIGHGTTIRFRIPVQLV